VNYHVDLSVLTTEPYLGWLLSGAMLTLALSAVATLAALPLGVLVGVMGSAQSRPMRIFARLFVEVFRNVPLVVQLFIWFFVVPELLPREWGRWVKRDLPSPEFWSAAVGLSLYTAARVGEQVRAGIAAVGPGLRNAGLALGLRPAQAYRYILLPLALRAIIPPLTSEMVSVVKNSSLASAIGVLELTQQGRQIETYTFRGFEAFGAVTAAYLLIASLLIIGAGLLERRTRLPGAASGRA
jgi:glutamate/aspartate transport system permease protein